MTTTDRYTFSPVVVLLFLLCISPVEPNLRLCGQRLTQTLLTVCRNHLCSFEHTQKRCDATVALWDLKGLERRCRPLSFVIMTDVGNFAMNGFCDPQQFQKNFQMFASNMEQFQPNQYTQDGMKSVPNAFGTPIFNFANFPTAAQMKSDSNERKRKAKPVPKEKQDAAYFEKRAKNNDSARKSREERRRKDEITRYECERLQAENMKLRQQIEFLNIEMFKLKSFLTTNNNPIAWNPQGPLQ